MIEISKISILSKIFNSLPIIILFISVLNEFDFNYLNFKYFSFNFPFILIFLLELKRWRKARIWPCFYRRIDKRRRCWVTYGH